MDKRILLGIILLMGFIMAVSIASLYAQSHLLAGTACGCEFPIEMLIPMLSSAGLLVGFLVYYFMGSYSKGKKEMAPLLSLIDSDQRRVIEVLVKNGGAAPQSRLVEATNMNKVKVSRVVADLETRGVVRKTASGMTNLVELEHKFKNVLV